MGYFKDWQKNRRNIHEALNRLPNDQEPQHPQAPIVNNPQDVARMEREHDLKLLGELEQAAARSLKSLTAVKAFLKSNPQTAQYARIMWNDLYMMMKTISNMKGNWQSGPLSQHLSQPPSQQPPSMN